MAAAGHHKMGIRLRNRPEFYFRGDRLEKYSYNKSYPIKRLQIWYRLCQEHDIFREKETNDMLDLLISYEDALGINENSDTPRNIKCSKAERIAYKKDKQIIWQFR